MPLEVRELVIRANVLDENAQKKGQQISSTDLANLKKDIVDECVDKMKDMLNKKDRR